MVEFETALIKVAAAAQAYVLMELADDPTQPDGALKPLIEALEYAGFPVLKVSKD